MENKINTMKIRLSIWRRKWKCIHFCNKHHEWVVFIPSFRIIKFSSVDSNKKNEQKIFS